MTFKSCPMVYHTTKDSPFFDWPPGHFYWSVDADGERYIWMMLPRQDNEEGSPCCIPVRPTPDTPSWGWDGNLEKPTPTCASTPENTHTLKWMNEPPVTLQWCPALNSSIDYWLTPAGDSMAGRILIAKWLPQLSIAYPPATGR